MGFPWSGPGGWDSSIPSTVLQQGEVGWQCPHAGSVLTSLQGEDFFSPSTQTSWNRKREVLQDRIRASGHSVWTFLLQSSVQAMQNAAKRLVQMDGVCVSAGRAAREAQVLHSGLPGVDSYSRLMSLPLAQEDSYSSSSIKCVGRGFTNNACGVGRCVKPAWGLSDGRVGWPAVELPCLRVSGYPTSSRESTEHSRSW